MIKKIELIVEVDTPSINGIVYRKEIMEKIAECLNQPKFIPITVNINYDEYTNFPVGRVIPRTAFFNGKKIYVDVDIEDYVINLIESNEFKIGICMTASLNNNEVILCEKFDVIELQIIKNPKGEIK